MAVTTCAMATSSGADVKKTNPYANSKGTKRMRVANRYGVILLATLVVLTVIVGLFGFAHFTQQRYLDAVDTIGWPPILDAYTEMVAFQGGYASGLPEDTEVLRLLVPDGDKSAALARIAQFERTWDWMDRQLPPIFSRGGQSVNVNPAWEELELSLRPNAPLDWDAGKWARTTQFVGDHRDLIDAVRELSELEGPAGLVDPSRIDHNHTYPKHLTHLHSSHVLLEASAIVSAKEGDARGAVRDIIAMLRLADMIGREPFLASQDWRSNLNRGAVSTLQRAFGPRELPADVAGELLAELARDRSRESFVDAMKTGHVEGQEMFSRLLTNPVMSPTLSNYFYPDTLVNRLKSRWYGSLLGRPWFNMDRQAFSECYRIYVEAAGLPFHQAKPMLDQLAADVAALPETRRVTAINAPHVLHRLLRRAACESNLDLARVGIALELHYTQHARYPDGLDAIAATLGGAVPVDTLTGQPFHYTPQGDTFLLYSVGIDLDDDGGVHNWGTGDIVWRGRKED